MSGSAPGERMVFIGVSTGGSSIMTLFPRWAELLGLDARIEGYDIPLGAPPAALRAAVEHISGSDQVRGGLVTTHKVGIFQHAGDLFADLDDYARSCGEVSCISKRNGDLVGHAKDPITAGMTLDHMVGLDHWRTSPGHVLCLGAGGAGVAISLCLMMLDHPPPRIVLTDLDSERLDAARAAHRHVRTTSALEYRMVAGDEEAGELVSGLPSESLIINATGMGKDRPGSPLPSAAEWPNQAIAWDLNYRGDLEFLKQARAVERERALRVFDGWRYFLHGWTEHLAEVFGIQMTPERFASLAESAQRFRPRPS
jgi:shikimate dehydrogenase